MSDHPGEIRLAYITCESREEALSIGRRLVAARLAACANVIGGMTSVYRWQGEVETGEEVVLIAKTRAENMAALTHAVKAAHSYSVPCVLSIPVAGGEGNEDFLAWLRDEATPQD